MMSKREQLLESLLGAVFGEKFVTTFKNHKTMNQVVHVHLIHLFMSSFCTSAPF